jgi:hypothetical protein
MTSTQTLNEPRATQSDAPTATNVIENWASMNARLAQRFLDAGLAQMNGLQGLMRTPGADTGHGTTDMWHAQVELMRKQTDEAIALSRQLADEARKNMFDIADALLQLPFAGQGGKKE